MLSLAAGRGGGGTARPMELIEHSFDSRISTFATQEGRSYWSIYANLRHDILFLE